MIPRDPSFWWRVRFFTDEVGRVITNVLKGLGDSADLIIMVDTPNERNYRRSNEMY